MLTFSAVRRLLVLVAIASPAIAFGQVPEARHYHDIIRGTVTSDSGKAVAGADVIVTRAPDRAFESTKTDDAGRYQIEWADGTGDYLVHVSAVGYDTFRKRVTRTGTDSVFVVDVKLSSGKAQVLAPVVTRASKPKPARNEGIRTDVGASQQLSGGVTGAVSPDQAGDIAALAGTIPGVMLTPDGGISVLGLGSAQNSTTLNGMAFPGADVPRDAETRVRVSQSSYDPSRGWFSGANLNVELTPGNLFSSRNAHLTLDAPPLQYTDPISARLGQRFTAGEASIGGNGELADDKWFYNFGVQGARRSADEASLLNADQDLLEHAGVSPDSAARLISLLQAAGIPTGAGAPSTVVHDDISAIVRVDHAPYNWGTLTPAKTTYALTGYAKYANNDALGLAPTGTPLHTGESSQAIGSLQGEYSFYFGNDYLGDARTSVSYNRTRSNPFLQLPDGRVLVESAFPNGTGGVSSLQFGGNSGMNSEMRQWTWESVADLQLYAQGKQAHRIKLTGDARLDGYSQDIASNGLGTFSYNSLADLSANTPSTFTRTLESPTRTGGEWNGFAALSDLWRVSQNLQVMYGARAEGNVFTAAPAYNPEIETLFGVRTDHAPNTVHVSPRIGFTWNKTGRERQMMMVNPFGRFTQGSSGVLRGGFGEFRNIIQPALLSAASVSTGLPGALTHLSCIGSAVPTPDWTGYLADPSSIPQQCAGAGAPSFIDAAPGVQLFDPAWNASRSWRGNLAWNSSFWRFTYSIEGVYSLNLNQPGIVDLNFAGQPKFTLPVEGRPMYANSSSIVPATGALSPVDARRSNEFGRVVDNLGDNRSISKQLTFTVAPDFSRGFLGNVYLAGGYTLASVRSEQRGFDASTFGNPLDRDWTRGDLDARHQFLLQAGFAKRGFNISLQGRLQSGLPFTPLVGSDVNGDGLANDRAFIYDPATSADPAMSAAMQTLIASSDPNVRDCLTRQLDHAAARNSCEGPWTSALNARIGISGRALKLGNRVDVGINLANPLGGLDQLLHGSNNLHGWGTQALPDPVLYTVRGWDPNMQRFDYDVNPRFGSTRPSANTIRAPFRLTIDVGIDIGRPIDEQQLDKFLSPGRGGHRGTKLTAADLEKRYARNVPDPYAQILRQSDSLLLSRAQADSLEKIQAHYKLRMDSLWTDLANYLAQLPDEYDAAAALKRSSKATDDAWELTRQDVKKELPTVLTPVQLQILPGIVKTLYESKEPLHIRMFIMGNPS